MGRQGSRMPTRPPADGAPKVPRILVAEDQSEMRRLLASVLRRDGFEVVEAASGVQLLDQLTAVREGTDLGFDLLVSDVRMPGLSGLETIERARATRALPPLIVITAFGDEETHQRAHRLGAVAIFDKPFDIDDLRTAVEYFLTDAAQQPPERTPTS